jgi:hypothetical protein
MPFDNKNHAAQLPLPPQFQRYNLKSTVEGMAAKE